MVTGDQLGALQGQDPAQQRSGLDGGDGGPENGLTIEAMVWPPSPAASWKGHIFLIRPTTLPAMRNSAPSSPERTIGS